MTADKAKTWIDPNVGKPEPTPSERKAVQKAMRFVAGSPERHRFKLDRAERGRPMSTSAPHSNTAGHLATNMQAFGTGSQEFASNCTGWVASMVRRSDADFPTEKELNAGMAAVGAVEAENELEGMLAVQMAGTHELAMTFLSRAKESRYVDHMDKLASAATKLLRTYTTQIEALAKIRRRGEQTVRVEHVHVHPGGQAIVGNVAHQPGGTGGYLENGRQPHAPDASSKKPAPSATVSAAVLCPDTLGEPVPVASGERESAVPDARRRQRERRARG